MHNGSCIGGGDRRARDLDRGEAELALELEEEDDASDPDDDDERFLRRSFC